MVSIELKRVRKMPIAVIDNFYSEEEYAKILDEMIFLSQPGKLKDPEDTGSAVNHEGEPLKSNKGCFVDHIYADRAFSDILRINRKLFTEDVMSELSKSDNVFDYLRVCNRDVSLMSYYENGDHYKPHRDIAVLTALTWFHKTPKRFKGGDLTFEQKVTVECIPNRLVIFPSFIYHEVSEVQMEKQYQNGSNGRFTMTQFASFQ